MAVPLQWRYSVFPQTVAEIPSTPKHHPNHCKLDRWTCIAHLPIRGVEARVHLENQPLNILDRSIDDGWTCRIYFDLGPQVLVELEWVPGCGLLDNITILDGQESGFHLDSAGAHHSDELSYGLLCIPVWMPTSGDGDFSMHNIYDALTRHDSIYVVNGWESHWLSKIEGLYQVLEGANRASRDIGTLSFCFSGLQVD